MRAALVSRLIAEDADDLAARLGKCGALVHLTCTNCGTVKTCESRCDLKWCPSCQHGLAASAGERYANAMTLFRWPLRATVTVKNYGYDEPDAVRQFRRALARMTRQRWFRRITPGGIVGVEITDRGNGYHVHAHLLIECEWLALGVLPPSPALLRSLSPVERKQAWLVIGRRATAEVAARFEVSFRRATSVECRRVWKRDGGDIRKALAETLKYSTKGSDLLTCRSAGAVIRQMDGTRMITSFGFCHGKKEVRKVKSGGCPCEQCGEKGTLVPESVVESIFRSVEKARRPRR